MYNYGRKFTVDITLIEDSIQEVFLSLWNNRDAMGAISSQCSYLLSSFRYTLFKKIKQGRRTLLAYESDDIDFSVENFIINKEVDAALRQKFQSAIARLNTKQREAIYLRFYEGLSYEEIAAITGITVKGVYKLMARSIKSLKETMAASSLAVVLFLPLLMKD